MAFDAATAWEVWDRIVAAHAAMEAPTKTCFDPSHAVDLGICFATASDHPSIPFWARHQVRIGRGRERCLHPPSVPHARAADPRGRVFDAARCVVRRPSL